MKKKLKAWVDKVAKEITDDPERVQALLNTLGDLQARRKDMGNQLDQIMGKAGLATQKDVDAALRRVNRLRRRCKQLIRTLDRYERKKKKSKDT